jgi:hypothetical protein
MEVTPRHSPAFDGGEVRHCHHQRRRMIAAVRSTHANTAFGFHVLQREDVFYDRRFAELALGIQIPKFLRDALRQGSAMTCMN